MPPIAGGGAAELSNQTDEDYAKWCVMMMAWLLAASLQGAEPLIIRGVLCDSGAVIVTHFR
jgi:hypothetical protein